MGDLGAAPGAPFSRLVRGEVLSGSNVFDREPMTYQRIRFSPLHRAEHANASVGLPLTCFTSAPKSSFQSSAITLLRGQVGSVARWFDVSGRIGVLPAFFCPDFLTTYVKSQNFMLLCTADAG
jgi:hypothetical protein